MPERKATANPVVRAEEQYIESQRVKGKTPGSMFFMLPGAKSAVGNLVQKDREAKGISNPGAKRQPTGFTGISKVLSDRKQATDSMSEPKSYKKGGMVKKTGMARVHKGERVMTKRQVKRMGKRMKGK